MRPVAVARRTHGTARRTAEKGKTTPYCARAHTHIHSERETETEGHRESDTRSRRGRGGGGIQQPNFLFDGLVFCSTFCMMYSTCDQYRSHMFDESDVFADEIVNCTTKPQNWPKRIAPRCPAPSKTDIPTLVTKKKINVERVRHV